MSEAVGLLVDDDAKLSTAAERLRAELALAPPWQPGGEPGAPAFFLDTEFESNRSGTRLCLLQVSVGGTAFLFDALRLQKLASLAPLLQTPGCLWVLHAGLQDIRLIEGELGVKPPEHVLDTQIAWALLGPEYSVSLAYLEYKLCGVRADKGHQADDWVRRPIPPSQLAYAADDVVYLPRIYEAIRARLLERDRLGIALAATKSGLFPEPEPLGALRLDGFRNAWQLSPAGLGTLSRLVDWYNAQNDEGRALVGDPKVLLTLAMRRPRTKDDLGRIKGVGRALLERRSRELLELLQRQETPGAGHAVPLEPPAYGSWDDIRFEAWLGTLRAEVCHRLSVAPELALPSRTLRRLEEGYQQAGTEGLAQALKGYRRDLLEQAVREFCREFPPPA